MSLRIDVLRFMNWISKMFNKILAIGARWVLKISYGLLYRTTLTQPKPRFSAAHLIVLHADSYVAALKFAALLSPSTKIIFTHDLTKKTPKSLIRYLNIDKIPLHGFIKYLNLSLSSHRQILLVLTHINTSRQDWNFIKKIDLACNQRSMMIASCEPTYQLIRFRQQFRINFAEFNASETHTLSRLHKLYRTLLETYFYNGSQNHSLFESLLLASIQYARKATILKDSESKLTYQQLLLRSLILGYKLKSYSMTHERIGIMLPNVLATAVSFFALQAFDRTPAFINFTAGSHAILKCCEATQLTQVITSKKFIRTAQLEEVINLLLANKITVYYLEELRDEITAVDKAKGWLRLLFSRLVYSIKKRNSEHTAVVLFTSGSEGEPKGVALSHANILANCRQIRSVIAFSHQDILFNPLPMFHSFGLTAGMLLPVLSGTKTILYPSPLHFHDIPSMIKKTRATILFGTDTFLNGYAHYAKDEDFSHLRYVFAGAEKLRSITHQLWLEKFKINIYEGYGATEAAPVLSLNTPVLHQLGTVGCFLPGIHYRLVPLEGVKNGGRLSVHGPNLMLGYYLPQTPGILKQQGSWHDTGDIAEINSLGFVNLLGRAKRFAKIAGEMISLLAVENYIYELWPSYHHAVISKPHPHRGEILVLITNYTKAHGSACHGFGIHFTGHGVASRHSNITDPI